MGRISSNADRRKIEDIVDPTTGECFPPGFERLSARLALVSRKNRRERRSLVRVQRREVRRRVKRVLRGIESPRGGKWRVVDCGDVVLPSATGVVVCRSKETGNAEFRNLKTCGSVWTCPVCSSKIALGRRDEVRLAIQRHLDAGGAVLSVTLTLRHGVSHSAAELLDGMAPALKRMRSNRRIEALRGDTGFIGGIKALEVTYGFANGWHPHVHELWFVGPEAAEIGLDRWHSEVAGAWISAVKSSALPEPSFERGCVVKFVTEAREYEGKGVGVIDGIDGTWDAADEIAGALVKEGRDGRFAPFDLLLEGFDGLFIEYARAFFGKRQLTWSPGLKAHFQIGERSDEALAREDEKAGEPVMFIPRADWRRMVRSDLDLGASVLGIVEGPGGVSAACEFLARLGIRAGPWSDR